MKFARPSIALQIALLAIALVALTGYVIKSQFGKESRAVLVEHEERDLHDDARLTREWILTQISILREDVLKLAGHPAVRGIVRAQTRGETDLDTDEASGGPTEEVWRDQLEAAFKSICRNDAVGDSPKPYLQVRLIGKREGNKEILRIERQMNQAGEAEFVSKELQSKPTAHYFEATRKLHPQEIYISDFELNSEKAKKQIHQPVLRASVPIFADDYAPLPKGGNTDAEDDRKREEAFFGIIIINFDLTHFSEYLKRSPKHLYYLANDRGNILVHPDENMEFVWNFDKNSNSGSDDGATPTPYRSYRDIQETLKHLEKHRSKPIEQSSDYVCEWRKGSDSASEDTSSTLKSHLIPHHLQPDPEDTFALVSIDVADGNPDQKKDLLRRLKELRDRYSDFEGIPGDEGIDKQTRRLTIRHPHYEPLLRLRSKLDAELGTEKITLSEPAEILKSTAMTVELIDPDVEPRLLRIVQAWQRRTSPLRIQEDLKATTRWAAIRHHNKATLRNISTVLAKEFPWLSVGEPIECKTFAGRNYRLQFDPLNPERHLSLVAAVPYEEMEARFARADRVANIFTIASVAVAALLALLFSRLMTRPLRQITEATKAFAAGGADLELPTNIASEFGVLARAFDSMRLDVRKRGQALRESEARLRAILDNAAEAIILVNEDGRIDAFNEAANKIFGYTLAEARNRLLTDLFDEADHGAISDSLIESGKSDAAARAEAQEGNGRRRDGVRIPVEYAISEFRLEGQQTRTVIVRDITERKSAEQQMRQWNEDLTLAVDERTAELEQANSELKAARDRAHQLSEAKSAFLASVSHELRNPLNQVSGFCQLLEFSELNDDQLGDVKKIRTAASQLLNLVNDILDYQKIIMGGIALECEQVDVAELLDELRDAMGVQTNDNQNQLEFQLLGEANSCYADKQRIRQVLLNLLGNACKFTKQGDVTVTAATGGNADARWVEFAVKDTGRGMTEEEQLQLREFRPFTTLSSREGNAGGTGLGLVISKGFCEMMAGSLHFTSEYEKGTTFTVRLPATEQDRVPVPTQPDAPRPTSGAVSAKDVATKISEAIAATEKNSSTDAAGSTSKGTPRSGTRTVLVIDDDVDVCEMMDRYLTRRGFHVVTTRSGLEGLRLAAQLKPAVITLDAVMPELDGWATLAALKANEVTATIPVVMVTIVDDEHAGRAQGAAEFLNKPVDWEQLSAALAKYTGDKREQSILVVDDDASTREILRRQLEHDGWSVLEAEHGEAALAVMAYERPAAILLDLMMPVMNGFEFLAEFSQLAEWLSVPIIVLSAKDPSPTELEKLEGNVVRVLRKGNYSHQELLAEIHRRVDQHVHAEPATSKKG